MTLEALKDEALRVVARLSDHELEIRLTMLVQRDQHVTADLLAHIAEMDARRLYASSAYPSAFQFCVARLGFSEDVAYKRIAAARVVRQYPLALELVREGKLHLSGLLLVAPRLTEPNHGDLLRMACGRTKREVERLLAERFPRPDVPARIRKLPETAPGAGSATPAQTNTDPGAVADAVGLAAGPVCRARMSSEPGAVTATIPGAAPGTAVAAPAIVLAAAPCTPAVTVRRGVSRAPATAECPAAFDGRHRSNRARVEPLAPGRYRVTFTASAELREKLERAHALASHCVPPGDLATLIERALDVLIAHEQRRRFALKNRPAPDESVEAGAAPTRPSRRRAAAPAPKDPGRKPQQSEQDPGRVVESRHVPADTLRAVWERDGGRCTFVDRTGQRCTERRFLEVDHIEPHALGGPATLHNLRLLCSHHNALEARVAFGEGYVAHAIERRRARASARDGAL
jgi:hypothetical protein